ncbi:M28 family peptidase [Tenacibaculum tangerinum]|uniref:M28 family peptidase n=1 Tax=Tenacibaculum tangerinum TaxID=3038772 RepID=A0ABY8L3P0_9FLAO|nr:M28 family peptidase [Tenacibaculum tangerinum]WGH74818.1 M28 family peptidase [Tenacibaculum tangerinum]
MKPLLYIILTMFFSYTFSQKRETSNISKGMIHRIKNDLEIITKTPKPRNYQNIETLNYVANYIKDSFKKVCDTVYYQPYSINNNEYKNVIGSVGIKNKERIIIGAHYDVFGDSNGADDNASGIVALLELVRMLSKENLHYRIDFVAYTLEEPPFFRTKQMGSYIHAKNMYDNKTSIKGMICLETIGYYNEQTNSQEYPIKGMSLLYGNKGDFITVVQNSSAGNFSNQVKNLMEEQKFIKTKSYKGSSKVEGVDFSDHLNYWKFNYDAVMITNTAFYRNKNYHTNKDTIETLDLEKISLVIQQLYQTILQIK